MAQIRAGASLTWHESSSRLWERDLDEAEIFYATLQKQFEGTGRKFFTITGHVYISSLGEVSKSVTEEQLDSALRDAWLRLRHSHPSIAVETVFDTERRRLKKTYASADGSQHKEWLKQTFFAITTNQSGAEWCNSDPPAPDLATLFVIRSTQSTGALSRHIVLRSPHDIIDGIGTLQLLGMYVQHLSAILDAHDQSGPLDWTSEHTRLTPPLRLAASLPGDTPADVQVALKKAHDRSSALISRGPPIMAVPCSREAKIPSAHQRVAIRLESSTTGTIIGLCKSNSVSVTHAYHAAAAMVLAQRQTCFAHERKMQYVSYALVNLRGQCLSPYNSTAHAASVYHCTSAEKFGIEFTIPGTDDQMPTTASSDFQRVSSEIRDYYTANRPSIEPMLLKIAPLLWHQGTPQIPEEAWTQSDVLPIPPPNPSPSISMSSFGIIDKLIPTQIGSLTVSDPWVTGEELGPGIGLFLGTFRGELELSAAFNAAWHDTDEIRGYLNDIQGTVSQGLRELST